MKKHIGKTIEEICGEEKGKELRKLRSERVKGENNPMYGKPSPTGSGNGWSGWYNGWYFRSLMELSFMINVIERFNFKWENGECKKYKIEYFDEDNIKRNYFPDFILNKKYMIEIKPKNLHNSIRIKQKQKFAIEYCNKNGLKYKLINPIKILTITEIIELVNDDKIKFLDRYKIKLEKWARKEQN